MFDDEHSCTYTVCMKNITLSVDEKVLASVRRYAVEHEGQVHRVRVLLASGRYIDPFINLNGFQLSIDVGNPGVFQEERAAGRPRHPPRTQ